MATDHELPVSALREGDQIRGLKGKPFRIGVCVVAAPLTPARRNGMQVGYRVRLTGPQGDRLSPQTIRRDATVIVVTNEEEA